MLWQVHDFSANPAATSQCIYDIPAILYFPCIRKKKLYLIDDDTIILHVGYKLLSRCYNVVTGS
jgi:hypothetical protein